jgi:hypothetical protein
MMGKRIDEILGGFQIMVSGPFGWIPQGRLYKKRKNALKDFKKW